MIPPNLPAGSGFARFTLVATTSVIAVLTFLFSFRNVWVLGDYLQVDTWIAPLVGPAVDLSVIGLLVVVQWLSLAGATRDELHPARRLLYSCGAVTMLLNSLPSAIQGWTHGDARAWGRAAFEAIAPWLLIAWSHVGPWLLRLFADIRSGRAGGQVRTGDVLSEDVSGLVADLRALRDGLSARTEQMPAHPDMFAEQVPVPVTMSAPVESGQVNRTQADRVRPAGRTELPEQVEADRTEHAADQQEQTEQVGEQVAGDVAGQAGEQTEERPRPDDELITLLREQVAEQIADRSLTRYRVQKVTGASARQAQRLLDTVLPDPEQVGEHTELVAAR